MGCRYETTTALPVEYGTVFVANSCSGLLFFDETKRMATWQVINVLVSVCIVLIGMIVGQLDRWGSGDCKPSTRSATRSVQAV